MSRASRRAAVAHRAPSHTIVSVNVPDRWRKHFDAATDTIHRYGPEQLRGCDVFAAWEPGGRTLVSVIPHAPAVEALRALGQDDIAATLAKPLPGRTRLVMLPPGEDAHVYGFRFGAMAPGGDA